tara:strand:- start:92 stop:421 length:330 start_codon:yes stop_codon:yes gene_type:complete
MQNEEKLIRYFKLFSEKNIFLLREMFSDDISLIDWEINAVGIDEVVEQNLKIFNSVSSIEVKLKSYMNEGKRFAAELEIFINEKDVINVVDIIEFDEKGFIKSIRAYKG